MLVQGQPCFRPDSDAGAHALRVARRVVALGFRPASAKTPRNDAEGIDLADVEAMSTTAWKRWVASLSPEQRKDLRLWRGGAIPTPIRRHRGPDVSCPWCQFDRPSTRHFFAECNHFHPHRRELEAEFGIAPSWWAAQPRITSKSGWITTSTSASIPRRGELQVAACQLGVVIVQACLSLDPG